MCFASHTCLLFRHIRFTIGLLDNQVALTQTVMGSVNLVCFVSYEAKPKSDAAASGKNSLELEAPEPLPPPPTSSAYADTQIDLQNLLHET